MSERTLDHNTHDHNNRHLPLIILIICRTDLLLLKLNTLGYTAKVFWICRLTYLPVNRNDSHRQYSSAMITKTEMQISDSLTARHYCDVTKLINVNLAGMRDSYLLGPYLNITINEIINKPMLHFAMPYELKSTNETKSSQ